MRKLSVGIVGLPNVGKSTLFQAITNSTVAAENYPFCTIDPNIGIVSIPDYRLDFLQSLYHSEKKIPATIEFVDIAGLVKGASKGEGLGNKFLDNIRMTSVIAHVVRCFDSTDITHVEGNIDPIRDIEIIHSELIIADLIMVEKMIETQQKKVKANQKDDVKKLDLLNQIRHVLLENQPARTIDYDDFAIGMLNEIPLITNKKVIYVANVGEDELADDSVLVKKVRDYAAKSGDGVLKICSLLESELSTLTDDEKVEYLTSLGLSESGLTKLSQQCFHLLGLQTYLTAGPKETRAWVIKQGACAPAAAGEIHTDFEKGFIRANIVSYDDLVRCKDMKIVKEKGLLRQEGKDYVMQDGDVVEFLFNV